MTGRGLLDRRAGPQRRGGGALPFSPKAYGSDLLLWLRDNLGVTLSTVGEWKDQSPSGLLFAQATQASRPVATGGGGAVGAGAGDGLNAASTALGATGATTVLSRFKKTSNPGTGYPIVYGIRADTAKSCHGMIGALAYPTWSFRAGTTGSTAWAGVNWTPDTSVHTWTVVNDGLGTAEANYVARIDGAGQTVVAGPATTAPATNSVLHSSLGTMANGTLYALVMYSSALTGATLAAAEALIASSTSAYADFAALGTVVCCLLPGVGQSGDVTPWTSQDVTARAFAQATLASQPYYDKDDTVGDLRESMIFDGTADNVAAADIAAFSGATKLTVGGWLRQNVLATAAIVGQWGGGDNCWSLEARVDGKVRLYTASGAADATNFVESDAAMITAATWCHVLAVLDGATAALYLNGALVASTITGAMQTLRNSAATVKVGTDATTYFAGRIDDLVCAAARAATASQANSLAHYYTRSG